jgi:hypothetical protein
MKRAASALLLVVACALGLGGCSAYDEIGANLKNDPRFDFPTTLRSPSDRSSSSGSTSSSFADR